MQPINTKTACLIICVLLSLIWDHSLVGAQPLVTEKLLPSHQFLLAGAEAGPTSDLSPKDCAAVDYAIALYIYNSGQSAMGISPPRLDDSEIKRLTSAMGPVKYQMELNGITANMSGSENTVESGGFLKTTLEGDGFSYDVIIGEGFFGIKGGKIVIGEKTHMSLNGRPYIRVDNSWATSMH